MGESSSPEEQTDSKTLPPDVLRCSRNDGKSWRCKGWRIHDKNLCEKHFFQYIQNNSSQKSKQKSTASGSRATKSSSTTKNHRTGGGGGSSVNEPKKPGLFSTSSSKKQRKRRKEESDDEVIPKKKMRTKKIVDDEEEVNIKGNDEQKIDCSDGTGDSEENENVSLGKGNKKPSSDNNKFPGLEKHKSRMKIKTQQKEEEEEEDDDEYSDNGEEDDSEEANLVKKAKKNDKIIDSLSPDRKKKVVGLGEKKLGVKAKTKQKEEDKKDNDDEDDTEDNEGVDTFEKANKKVKNVKNESASLKKRKKLGSANKIKDYDHDDGSKDKDYNSGIRRRRSKQKSLRVDSRRRHFVTDVSGDDCQMCHQCQRSDKERVVRCRRGCRKRFCIPCIQRW